MGTFFLFKIMKTPLMLLGVAAFLLGGTPAALWAAPVVPSTRAYEEIQVLKGDIQSIPAKNLKRVSITDPVVADINDARADAVDVIGIEAGQTILFIWDDGGKRTVVIRVVQEDTGLVKKRVQSLLTGAGVLGVTLNENADEGKVVITGSLTEEKMDVLTKVIEPFSDRVINLVQKEKIEDLIQIDMQITELSTTLTKAMGVDWGTGTATSDLTANYQENLPSSISIPKGNGSFKDLWKVGDFSRTNALIAAINAMIQEGKAKVLSKPRLVVISGKEATFLVGGEIPIKTTTTSASGGSTQQNVEFKEYGVSMAITPSIQAGHLVNILLHAEISEIDTSKPTGTDVAFLTRSANTQLLLEDKQTIVLAGMIKRRDNELVRRVPFMSRIPVVGMLFRSTKTPVANEETEVVISITPTILRSGKSADITSETKLPEQKIEARLPVKAAVVAPASATGVASKPIEAVKPPVVAGATALENYALTIQNKIASAIAYPYEAQEKNWQGTVKLALTLDKEGTLKDVKVKESSGYKVFDQDAVNTAQILAPYSAPPQSAQSDKTQIVVSIVYSLDSFLKNVATHN